MIKIFKFSILFFILYTIFYSNIYWWFISFEKIFSIKKIIEISDNKKISIIKKQISNISCDYFFDKNFIYLNYWCINTYDKFLEKNIIDEKIIIDYVFRFIENIDWKYESNLNNFNFYNSDISFKNENWYWFFLNEAKKNNIFVSILDKNNYFQLPIQKYYFDKAKKYTYYAVDKSLENRWNCSKINYYKAIEQMDWIILNPWEKLNFNWLMANIKDYCKWTLWKKLLFYWWVCWASTQLFRNSLINPYLKITKRYPHAQRHVNYYSWYIFWDDASIYEWTKQFEIENISKKKIYFKIIDLYWSKFMISIYPEISEYISFVEKKQTKSLQWFVKKNIIDKNTLSTRYIQEWISNYSKKDYSMN